MSDCLSLPSPSFHRQCGSRSTMRAELVHGGLCSPAGGGGRFSSKACFGEVPYHPRGGAREGGKHPQRLSNRRSSRGDEVVGGTHQLRLAAERLAELVAVQLPLARMGGVVGGACSWRLLDARRGRCGGRAHYTHSSSCSPSGAERWQSDRPCRRSG